MFTPCVVLTTEHHSYLMSFFARVIPARYIVPTVVQHYYPNTPISHQWALRYTPQSEACVARPLVRDCQTHLTRHAITSQGISKQSHQSLWRTQQTAGMVFSEGNAFYSVSTMNVYKQVRCICERLCPSALLIIFVVKFILTLIMTLTFISHRLDLFVHQVWSLSCIVQKLGLA